jgi:hypothetical protein
MRVVPETPHEENVVPLCGPVCTLLYMWAIDVIVGSNCCQDEQS